jgi:hypothetical protein
MERRYSRGNPTQARTENNSNLRRLGGNERRYFFEADHAK